jgi:hypothetical protein
MNTRNRLAVTNWGQYFTANNNYDYEGYIVPILMVAFNLIVCLPVFAALGLWWWLAGTAVFNILYPLVGLWLQTAKVNRCQGSTISAIQEYNRLEDDDKKMFPAKTPDTLMKYDSSEANKSVIGVVDEIKLAKTNATLPILEDFVQQLQVSKSVLADQKELR